MRLGAVTMNKTGALLELMVEHAGLTMKTVLMMKMTLMTTITK